MKSSTLDHYYCQLAPKSLRVEGFNVGDHLGLSIEFDSLKEKPHKPKLGAKTQIRDWRKYNKTSYVEELRKINWEKYENLNAQQLSDFLDQDLLITLHKFAPEFLLRRDENNLIWSVKSIKQRRKRTI